MFHFVYTFVDKSKSLTLPLSDLLQEVTNNFNSYFLEKIRCNFHHIPAVNLPDSHLGDTQLTDFYPTTIEEIREILKSSPIKCSINHRLPTALLSENIDMLLPFICDLINVSLSTGNIGGVKLAHITRLVKGYSLDSNNLMNYKPIYNLSFVGKLIERVVIKRLNDFTVSSGLTMSSG